MGRDAPDIEVWRGPRVRSVLDTKYKKTSGGSIKNPDFYQVLSYCEAEGTPLGALIDPQSEFADDDEILIRNSNIRIRRFAIDLTVPSEALLSAAEALVGRVVEWITGGEAIQESA